jgi:hypothetical protein
VLFNIARCYTQCSSLTAALAAGLKDSTALEVEPDLDPIRRLAQFKVILDRLKAAPVANAN